MAGQDFMTMTPGSAVADTIQGILQRRREEARQAMLDQLESERVHSGIANDTKRTGFEGERVGLERDRNREDALTAAVTRNEAQHRIDLGDVNAVGEGADLSTIDPGIAANARKYGRSMHQAGGTPTVGSSYGVDLSALDTGQLDTNAVTDPTVQAGPAVGGRDIYVSPKEAEKHVTEQGFADFLAQHPNISDPKSPDYNPSLAQVLAMNAAGLETSPTPEMLNPPPSVVPISPEGKKEGAITGQRGTTFMPRPYPPTPPSAYITPQQVVIPNPQDDGKLWMAWIKPGEKVPTFIAPAVPGAGKTGSPDANDITNNNGGAQSKIIQASNNLRQAMSQKGADREQAIAVAKASLLASVPMSQTANSALNQVIDSMRNVPNPSLGAIPSNLANLKQAYPALNDQDLQIIRNILTVYISAVAQ